MAKKQLDYMKMQACLDKGGFICSVIIDGDVNQHITANKTIGIGFAYKDPEKHNQLISMHISDNEKTHRPYIRVFQGTELMLVMYDMDSDKYQVKYPQLEKSLLEELSDGDQS